MKVNEKRIYPYPVYRDGSDDYKSVGFETNIELLYNNEQAIIQFKILIEDNAILKLIDNNQVGVFCHVECSKTKYRQMFELDGTDRETQYINIDLSQLNGDIEVR